MGYMSLSLQQVELWLAATIGPDEAALRSATAALESAQSIPCFPLLLLALSSGSSDEGIRLAAAIYLKNLLKDRWQKPEFLQSHEERHGFRNQLADTILRTDAMVLKTLAEAFSVIIDYDFVQKNNWPELVPSMKYALQTSNLLNRQGVSEVRTFNVLVAVQKMVRPFQYFMKPTVAKEPVPEQLELIASELLVQLYPLFQVLVEEAKMSKEYGASDNDNSLLLISKCFHLAVRAHMPSSLQLHLGSWCSCFFIVLETVQLQYKVEEKQNILRVKTWKRSLQIFCTLVTRHRKHVDKILPILSNVLMNLLTRMTSMTKDLHPSQERVISVAFDTISNILETGPGWRLISSHFSSLLEAAIFPALKLKEKDLSEWDEDQEEYLRKNLSIDTEFTCGWKKDHFTPRKSALHLLDLISISKGSPTSTSKGVNSAKRKKAGKSTNSRDHGTAGELLIVPFLSQFRPPPDGCSHTSEPVINYYGALLAYGGLQQFFEKQKTDHIHMLLQNRVLPLYSLSSPSPVLLANANWVLGMFASFLPEELSKEIYDALLKAFLVPDGMDMSWKPVRNSAAAALSALLEVEFKPTEWLPLLQALIIGVKSEDDDDASAALRVLAKIADAVEEDVVPHLPAIISSLKPELCKRIPDIPEPWPEVVESGFSAIVALAQTWDSAGSESDGGDSHIPDWKEGCVVIGSTISDLLHKSWLNYPEGVIESEVAPPSSCLNDASALVALMLKYTTQAERVMDWRIEEILHVWSELIAEWSAWEEEEDLAVFDAIKEIISLQERFPLPRFAVSAMPPPPALPVPARSILEGITSFISSAIEVAYAAATWRACKFSHALLHVSSISFESDDITPLLVERLSQAAKKRLLQLSSHRVPLAKPLVLLIAACYVFSVTSAANVLSEITESRALLIWAEALADLLQSTKDPKLALESEFKLAVAALVKLLENLFVDENCYQEIYNLRHKLFQSLLSACIHLKELEDYEEESNAEDENDNDSEEEEEEEEEVDDTDEDDDSEDGDLQETEEQFLERYAQKARDLQNETLEEAEGGEEEDGQELDIGVLGLNNPMPLVNAFLENRGKEFVRESSLPHELLSGFLEHFPDSVKWF